MTNEYRIDPAGPAFIVIDPWGEQVGIYPSRLVKGGQSFA